MKKQLFIIVLCVLIVSLTACGSANSAPAENIPETTVAATTLPAETAPDTTNTETQPAEVHTGVLSAFSTTDLAGNAVDQKALAGHKLTMVNVWATFCGPCLNEMPDLGELAEEYADKGVQIIGLVTDVLDYDGSISQSQLETAQELVTATGADYLHILPSSDMYFLSEVTAVPTTFFVNEYGEQVGTTHIGARAKADWASIIDETLAEVS